MSVLKLKVTDSPPETEYVKAVDDITYTKVYIFKAGRKRIAKFFVKLKEMKMEMSIAGDNDQEVVRKVEDFLRIKLPSKNKLFQY